MKKARFLSLLLALLMMSCLFSGCQKDGKTDNEKAQAENGEISDEDIIKQVMEKATAAISDFNLESTCEYVLDDSELEKTLLAFPDELSKGIEKINKSVEEALGEVSFLLSDSTEKEIKKTVSEGIEGIKDATIASLEFEVGKITVSGDFAEASVTAKVGGKKLLFSVMSGGESAAKDVVMKYADKVINGEAYKDVSTLELLGRINDVVSDVIREIEDEIKNGEKTEEELKVTLQKVEGAWLITEMK